LLPDAGHGLTASPTGKENDMTYTITLAAGTASIRLPQNFDHHTQSAFRRAYAGVLTDAGVKTIELDFAAVEYIDSSALGNLLLLRERATQSAQAISFTRCRTAVKGVLKMANFHRIFEIH
jgi:anti-anti-sigma factor